jgi:hypothetical protein
LTWSTTLFGLLWVAAGVFIIVREIPIFLYLQKLPPGAHGKGAKIRSALFLAMGGIFIAAAIVLLGAYYMRH